MNIDEYYDSHYEEVINSGIIGKFASYYHFLIERGFQNMQFENILEVGAGKGQHKKFVRSEYGHYLQTDIREFKNFHSDSLDKSSWVVADAQNLNNFIDGQFDRTIATCLIVHLADPENALREWRRVTSKNGGYISIYLPCEPSLFLRLGQKLSTRRKTAKLGVDYDAMHYREHRNHYFYIKSLILDIFQYDKIKVVGFPFRLLPFDLKLYEVYQIELKDTGDTKYD